MNANLPNLPPPPAPKSKLVAIVSMGLALALAGLWAIDRFLGRDKVMIVLMILVVFLAALLVIWIIVWLARSLLGRMSAARRRRDEEAAAAPRLGASPQEGAELDGLQERITTAVRVLRESKLGRGKKGDEALYTLPWVLLLGPGGSGKTTVLQECGLDFPYTTAEGLKQRGAPPASGEFWFSRHGIVIDLQGRIAAEDELFNVFKGFLDQLKRARRERPLDGVVVTADIDDLLKRPAREVERLAGALRQRLDEMVKRLGIRFPIYVLFTKCDRIEGFYEFFGGLRSRDRAHGWGATIARALRKTMPNEKIFLQEFDRLVEHLHPFRLQAMAAEKNPQNLASIYAFPNRMGSIRSQLSEFMSALLQPTPYSERPIFRGFYLTTARQIHAPVQEAPPVRPAWEPGQRLAEAQESKPPTGNFFLESLFPKVLFADRPQAIASVSRRLQRRLWIDVALVATAVACIVLLVGMIFSFTENRALIESAQQAAVRLADAGWDGKRTTDLMAMENLRQKLGQLDRHASEGAPWSLRWGLYSGHRINPGARRVYFRRLRQSFVSPAADALRQQLNTIAASAGSPSSYGELYTCLKAYLMMTEPSRAEAPFLSSALVPIWKGLAAPEAEDAALKQLHFYAEQLPKNEPELNLTQDAAVVARARNALSRSDIMVRLYNSLKSDGNAKFQPYTLSQATGGRSLDYLVSSLEVPGVFTETAWRSYFKAASADASKAVIKDDWVLGPTYSPLRTAQVSDADYQRQILDMYFAEYSDAWLRFLEGISVRPLSDVTEARIALNAFSQQDSAISRLLMNVAAQTMLRREPEKGGSISEMVSGALATLGLSARVNRDELISVVADQFLPLHDLVTSPDGKTPSLSAQYVEVLGKMHSKLEALFGAGAQWEQVKAYIGMIATNISGDEFHDAFRVTARVNQLCRTRSTLPIGPLLEKPLREAWAALLRDAGYRLDGLWRTRVAEAYRREVEGRFPFNPTGQDLPLSLLAQFLKPGEGSVWVFYENELKPFLRPSESGWEPADLIGAKVDFSPAFLAFLQKSFAARQAVYGGGGAEPTITFDLTPEPVPGTDGSILEIDGQRLEYRNWRALPQAFTWPGKLGSPQARLTLALTGSGERPGTPMLEGEWAFFRLLNLARIVPQSQTTFNVTWPISSADGRRFEVRYRLQARTINNPFAPNFFAQIRCPERLTQAPATAAFR